MNLSLILCIYIRRVENYCYIANNGYMGVFNEI